ncbi:MAG: tyrosine-type recombinase/integrase [Pseudomonadota bacterium]|nr:tyrosine-type recombinase/integrase [Pseudomonadota bacterium]
MLTDKAIQAAKTRSRPYKLADGEGLTLLVKPNGSKLWRFRYRHDGREKMLGFGIYPDTSAKLAREKRDKARKQLAEGRDPSNARQAEIAARANTFEAVSREWLQIQKERLAPATYAKAMWTLETLVFPYLGTRPIDKIGASDVLKVLKRIEGRGFHETAHRTRQRISQVCRYAVITERAQHDVTPSLRGALAPVVTSNHAAIIEPSRIGELLRSIESYKGQAVTWYALRIAPLVFVRPGELRHAEWSELDLDGDEPQWRIPPEKMKMREHHIVPLAKQVVTLLRELYGLTGGGTYLFPALTTTKRCMSENTVNLALRRMGYSNAEMTGHGFRSTASTCLNEQGWHPDLIELQLAHAERNSVRAAYNKAQHLPERRKMMQTWADYLDGLRAGVMVIPLRRAG